MTSYFLRSPDFVSLLYFLWTFSFLHSYFWGHAPFEFISGWLFLTWGFSQEGIFSLSVWRAHGNIMAWATLDISEDPCNYPMTGVSAGVLNQLSLSSEYYWLFEVPLHFLASHIVADDTQVFYLSWFVHTFSHEGLHMSSCSSVAQLCPTLCDPVDCSTPGFLALHYYLEFAQTHVHWVSGAIQPSPPLLPSSHPAFSVSKHQGLNEPALHIRWSKYWSFNISPSKEYLGLISFRIDWYDLLAVQELSIVFSNTAVQRHQFFRAQPFLLSSSYIHTWLLEKS